MTPTKNTSDKKKKGAPKAGVNGVILDMFVWKSIEFFHGLPYSKRKPIQPNLGMKTLFWHPTQCKGEQYDGNLDDQVSSPIAPASFGHLVCLVAHAVESIRGPLNSPIFGL